MAEVTPATASLPDGSTKPRPEKPDEAKYKADLEEAEKNHKAAQAKLDAIRTKLENARTGKDSPANERFKALVEEQKAIRTKQQSHKAARTSQHALYDKNEEEIKKLIKNQTEAKQRLGFKNIAELDAQAERLQKQVDSGQMRLVDEKKTLTQITTLNKQRKEFKALEDSQKVIDQKKIENTELKRTFDNPEARALAETYERNQKELDEIKAAREGTNKSFENLKAEREKLNNEQKEAYNKIRQVKDNYFQQKKAYKEYEDMLYQQRRERQKAERDAYEKERRKKIAEQKLEEASEPAFLDQIRSAEGLIRHFDPSYGAQDGDKGPGQYAATAQRTIDDSSFKGMKVMKREDEDFFVGTGGKKKGKGRKGAATNGAGGPAPEAGKLNMNVGIIEELGKVGVEPPSTQADVPAVVEKLKERVAKWKQDQEAQTKKNIEKAKQEIERLEKEAAEMPVTDTASKSGSNIGRRREDRGKKSAQQNAGANTTISAEAELQQEHDAAADVAKDLKEASIEDTEA